MPDHDEFASDFERRWAEREERVERARGPFDQLCTLGMMHVDIGGALTPRGRLPVYDRLDKTMLALTEWRFQHKQTLLLAEQVALATWVVTDQLVADVTTAAAAGQWDPATTVWAMVRIRCAQTVAMSRVRAAWLAVREWRDANNQHHHREDEQCLAIRWTAETAAGDLAAHAQPGHDRQTAAAIVAGLRCGWRPFCRGCERCFTIEAPNRPIAGLIGVN